MQIQWKQNIWTFKRTTSQKPRIVGVIHYQGNTNTIWIFIFNIWIYKYLYMNIYIFIFIYSYSCCILENTKNGHPLANYLIAFSSAPLPSGNLSCPYPSHISSLRWNPLQVATSCQMTKKSEKLKKNPGTHRRKLQHLLQVDALGIFSVLQNQKHFSKAWNSWGDGHPEPQEMGCPWPSSFVTGARTDTTCAKKGRSAMRCLTLANSFIWIFFFLVYCDLYIIS